MKDCSSVNDCLSPKTALFTKGLYTVFECSKCGHRYTRISDDTMLHISKTYSDAYFFDGKDGYPNYLDEEEILINQGIRYAKLISKFKIPGKILDVGCAAGFALNGFKLQGWECSGIEPNKSMAEFGNKKFDLNIEVGNLESFNGNDKYDLITLIQVIGHFHNIDQALENVFNLLKPGGMVLVESWDRNSWIARLLGKYWHEYSPPSVIHWFSDDSLRELFRQHQLIFVDKGYPKKQINLKHAISLIDSMIPDIIGKKRIFNFFTEKLGHSTLNYPFSDLKWYVFRKEAK